MNLEPNQLKQKPKKVGKTDTGKDVFEVETKGGLSLIVSPKDGSFETLGTGPHRAVARHIAAKRMPGIQWSDLHKSESLDLPTIQALLPKYEAVTAAYRKAHGDK